MTDLESNKAISCRFNDLFDAGGFDGCTALLSPDMKANATGAPGPMDRTGFRKLAEQFHAAFSDGRHDYRCQVAEGDKVATYAMWSAVNTGAFTAFPRQGSASRWRSSSSILSRMAGSSNTAANSISWVC